MFDQILSMRAFIAVLLIFISHASLAQSYATTDEGKRVKLNENGTWEFVNDSSKRTDAPGQSFVKHSSATSLLKSKKNDFAIWYNPAKWQLSNRIGNDAAEYQLSLKGEDGYCMVITERIEIGVDNLKTAALKNAQGVDPDAVIEKEEDRTVNGNQIRMLRLAGTMSGIKFVYLGYYASNESGTVQLVCFTARNLFRKYEKDFEELLNGLTFPKN